jgi:hypothetical protein
LARPLSSITAPSQPLTAEPITEGDGMCGVCEAEANKELPISVPAAASAVLDATFLVKGEDVARANRPVWHVLILVNLGGGRDRVA